MATKGKFTHEAVRAWLLDRVAQYSESSGYPAFMGELVRGIRNGEVEAAHAHGELDDMLGERNRHRKGSADGK